MPRGEMKPIRAISGHREKRIYCHHYAVYDMTCEQFEQLKDRAGGRCEICKVGASALYRETLHIDHCHRTGRIRGLLCPSCNQVMACLDGVKTWGANRSWESVAVAYRDLPAPWDARAAPRSRSHP